MNLVCKERFNYTLQITGMDTVNLLDCPWELVVSFSKKLIRNTCNCKWLVSLLTLHFHVSYHKMLKTELLVALTSVTLLITDLKNLLQKASAYLRENIQHQYPAVFLGMLFLVLVQYSYLF